MANAPISSRHNCGGIVVAGVLAAATAVVLQQRRKRRQADAQEDFVIRDIPLSSAECPETGKIHSSLSNALPTCKPRFTPEERLRALAHVKTRIALLRAQREGQDLHQQPHSIQPLSSPTSVPTTQHTIIVSSPPETSPLESPRLPTMEHDGFGEVETTPVATVDRLPQLLSIRLHHHKEDKDDGTEITDKSDFFSSSSSSSSGCSRSYEDHFESFCEKPLPPQPRASYSGLCREILALAGALAGVVTIVNII